VALATAGSDDDEGNAADQGDATEDGRDGYGAGLLVLDIEGTDFSVLMFVGEAEASDCEADDAEGDEKNADDGGGFHGSEMLLSDLNSAGEMQICTEGWLGTLT